MFTEINGIIILRKEFLFSTVTQFTQINCNIIDFGSVSNFLNRTLREIVTKLRLSQNEAPD